MNTISLQILVIAFLLGYIPGQSALQHGTINQIHHVLCGQVGHDQAELSIQTIQPTEVIVVVKNLENDQSVFTKKVKTSPENDLVKKVAITGLKPKTLYQYTLSGNKKDVWAQGQFRTFPKGASSYKFVFGSCQETGSESDIFYKIKEENPLFYLQIGDLHYENIGTQCQLLFNDAYHRIFSSRVQSTLYRNTPIVYMWDDHDFGPNNTGANNPCRTIAIKQYKKYFPHYNLVFRGETAPISQSFEVGRVTFVLTDLRSQKLLPQYNGCERVQTGSNFGNEDHLNWFFKVISEAKKKGHVVAWISTYPWINAPGGPNYKCNEKDNWGGCPEERTKIADFIKEHHIPLFILSGDAHMIAMDDGSNSDYATLGGAPLRVFQAAAIDRPGSYKGGPYSHGYSTKQGQYGVVEVLDHGDDQICFLWYAKNSDGKKVFNHQGREIKMEFCNKIPNAKP